MTAAALGGIDDPIVLVGERPVAVAELWRTVLASILPSGSGQSVVVVHPTCWPQRRVDVVVDAARATVRDVVTVARRDLIAADHRDYVVIEIGVDLVAVSNGAELAARPRTDIAGIVRVVVGWVGPDSAAICRTTVLLDAPHGLPGAAETALEISNALWANGIATRQANVVARALSAAITIGADGPERLRRRIALGAAVFLTMGAAIALTTRLHPKTAASDDRRAGLVEGRVAVDVPADWTIQRVTGGPGSRRVQVRSVADPGAALHITQTYAPGTNLDEAAEVLRRAVSAQPPGVFVDFRESDEVAGRPAVTYREVRADKVVFWSVVLDGTTRISIGCESPAGREDAVREACVEAVRSARELAGTEPPPPASN